MHGFAKALLTFVPNVSGVGWIGHGSRFHDRQRIEQLERCDGRGITKTSVTPYVIWRSQTGR
jgi:hypothetical protein